MGFLEKILSNKNIGKKNESNNGKIGDDVNIYEELGVLQPFTALDARQFRIFIAELSRDSEIDVREKEAFEELWSCACVDMGGTGNNIWNLYMGKFEIYNKNNIKIRYEKKSSDNLDRYSAHGRANFVFISSLGGFVIRQHERNKNVFLVYTSEVISPKLLSLLQRVEMITLELKNDYGYNYENNRYVAANSYDRVEALEEPKAMRRK